LIATRSQQSGSDAAPGGPAVAIRILIALVAGLGTGFLLRGSGLGDMTVAIAEPIGQMWINGLRMCAVPLVVSCLVVSVGSMQDTAALGRLGRRALWFFILLLTTAAVFSAVVAWPLLWNLDVPPDVVASMRETAPAVDAESAAHATNLGEFLSELVPANPVQAAASGRMLPLIVFALLLGLAIRRAGEEPGQTVLGFFQGIAEAMFVLARWVLALAPIGVFALALAMSSRTGAALAGALAYYIILVIALTVLFGLVVLYPVATIGGGVALGRFVQGTIPVQAVAFSSRSSLASMPAMIDAARNNLGLSEEVTVFLVPLAGSIFRVGSAVAQTVGVLFLARLYGVPLDVARFAIIIVTVVLTTFSVPGIPGGSIIVLAPVLLAAGLPLSGIGLLLGVDVIPDMFRTVANVTGGMTAASVLGRRSPEPADARLPSRA
jgi:Na+/H+-dicarboxylate symporter